MVLLSLAFSQSGDSGEGRWLCKGMSRMTLMCHCHPWHSAALLTCRILGEENGKLMWLFSGSFSETCSLLPWNSEGSLTEGCEERGF